MNVFLVNSPFQYICANEARLVYKSVENVLVLFNREHKIQQLQMSKLVEKNVWDRVIEVNEKNRTFVIPKLISNLKKTSRETPINCLFYAEYKSWTAKLIINNLEFKKEVFFDDGSATIDEYELLIRDDRAYSRKKIFNDILLRIQGCKPPINVKQSKNFEIFTFIELQNIKHKVVKNNLTTLSKSTDLYNSNSPIGFIGQGAVGGKNQKSVVEYIEEIKTIKEKFDKPMIYFPHRSEICEVMEEVKKIPGLVYHHSEYPLEIELSKKEISLSTLVGMLSTAMYTSNILYPNMPIYNLCRKDKKRVFWDVDIAQEDCVHKAFLEKGIKDIYI